MPKFSVRKPLTVFVAVIAVIVLGVVAFLKMTPDLLPNMDFPFVIVMTTYPGATPEKVESAITRPLEEQMATLEDIKSVSSSSAENYSMISLEFNEDADLDAVTVDILQKISTVEGAWDDTVGTPYILKINPSMLPVMVSAVSMEGMDAVALSDFVENSLMHELEGTAGIASVSASGIINESMNVVLSEEKIEALNEKLFALIDEEFEEPEAELNDALAEIEKGREELEDGKDAIRDGERELDKQMEAAEEEIAGTREDLTSGLRQVNRTIRTLNDTKEELQGNIAKLKELEGTVATLESSKAELEAAVSGLASALSVIDSCEPAVAQVEAAIAAIRGNEALSEEEKQQQIAALESDPGYLQAKAALSGVDASLAAQGLDRAGARAAHAQAEAGLAEVNGYLATIDSTLSGMGISRADIPGAISEMEAGIAEIDAGLEELKYAKDEIKSGRDELDNAYVLLEEEREKAEDQLSGAAAQLKEGEQQLDDALGEVQDGIEQLEEAKKDAHKQADLRNIITMEMAANILAAQDFAMPAGYVEEEGVSWLVNVGDEFTSLEELEDLLLFDLGMEGMDPIYLSDVGDVFITDNAASTYSRINGADGVMLTFQKQSTAATAEASDNLHEKFDALEEKYEGLSFVPLMDQGDYIYLITEAIFSSLIWGAVFAIIILFLFLKDIKPTLITLCSIPISVVFAIVLMYFSGVTLNMISLSGLAVSVGMLVDNSVVVIENIYRLRAKGLSAAKAAVSGAAQVAAAITSSTLTTVCVFAPIVFVEGITRQLFTDMALTVGYSLLASLIVALTLVPAMSAGMLRNAVTKKQKLFDKFIKAYEKVLRSALNKKALVLILCVALLGASIYLTLRKGFIFMPEMDMPQISANLTMPEGSSLEDTRAAADETAAMIAGIEGVETVGAMLSTDSGLGGMGGSSEDAVTIYVTVSEDGSYSGNAVADEINERAKDLPYTVEAAGSGSMMSAMTMLTGSGITVHVFGNDLESLQESANMIADSLAEIEGVKNVSNGIEDPSPVIKFTVDKNAAMEKGLTTAQVYMEIAAALQTEAAAADIMIDNYDYSVSVTTDTVSELTPDYIKNYTFTVTDQEGEDEEVALSDICTITEGETLSAISRDDQRRYLTVSAEVGEGYNVTLLSQEAETLVKALELPGGTVYEFAGENETIMDAMKDLLLMMLLGMLLVYFIMVAQFQSLKSPFIVMFTIPLAFTGGLLGLLICNQVVSIIAMIGLVMLVGIIVNNGIVLVDYINRLRLAGAERVEAIVEAGMTRMRPILMTSATTILGLLVMALGTETGTELMQPVAIVCIGGLLYATVLTLFVVPIIYDMMNKKELRKVAEEDLVITEE